MRPKTQSSNQSDLSQTPNLAPAKNAAWDALHVSPIGGVLAGIFYLAGILGAVLMDGKVSDGWIGVYVTVMILIGVILMFAIKIAKQWEKAVVLRLGKFRGLRGPGMFWIIPLIDAIPTWIDHRVMVSPFSAEKTLTKDTVPVDVDAVLFWVVWDAEKASLEVEDYRAAITWAAQTALREVIGQMPLADILVGRAKMDADLQRIIDERTTPWGISVQSVEIRDVIIPAASGRSHEPPGAGRTRTPGAGYPGRIGTADCPQLCRSQR